MCDQRLNRGKLEHSLFKSPGERKKQNAQRREAPPLADPISRVTCEGHPWNGELVLGQMHRHRPDILGDRQIKSFQSEKADGQCRAGTTEYRDGQNRFDG